jgi:hypothetical protein
VAGCAVVTCKSLVGGDAVTSLAIKRLGQAACVTSASSSTLCAVHIFGQRDTAFSISWVHMPCL